MAYQASEAAGAAGVEHGLGLGERHVHACLEPADLLCGERPGIAPALMLR